MGIMPLLRVREREGVEKRVVRRKENYMRNFNAKDVRGRYLGRYSTVGAATI